MTIVTIWTLRSGISQESAVKTIMRCATARASLQRNHRRNAVDFVKEIVRRTDQCASSANAKPFGLTMTLKDTISDNEFLEFRQCFTFTYARATDKPSGQLKLFRVSITKKLSLPSQTMQNHTLMILACTKAEAFVAAVAEYPKYSTWDIELKEIKGPFSNGQVIMDVGLRVISDMDKLLTGF